MPMSTVSKKQPRPTLTPTCIFIGALVGGVVGALVRGGFTFYNLRAGGELGLLAAMPSAGIGFLCGAVAGGFCRAWMGALLGAVLSAGVFALFLLPFAYVFSVERVGDFTWYYLIQRAVAGAVAGGIGGWIGGRVASAPREMRRT